MGKIISFKENFDLGIFIRDTLLTIALIKYIFF